MRTGTKIREIQIKIEYFERNALRLKTIQTNSAAA
jgi:hypothetical protein